GTQAALKGRGVERGEPPKPLSNLPRRENPLGAKIHATPPTRLLIRGDVTRKGEVITPAAPSCVAALPGDLGLAADAADGDRRLKLAEWISSRDNPLFSRVIVNRIWYYHFGAGFVENPNDFGFNGGRPSHPELLDWLASEFIRSGWSIKQLHRLILSSQAYQQSSRFDARAAAKDGDNRLLWRHSP